MTPETLRPGTLAVPVSKLIFASSLEYSLSENESAPKISGLKDMAFGVAGSKGLNKVGVSGDFFLGETVSNDDSSLEAIPSILGESREVSPLA